MKRHVFAASLLLAAFSIVLLSCSVLQQFGNALVNLQRCQFKLDGVNDFNLNVAAINPTDSTGGTPKATATLTSFAWTLLVDSTATIGGNIVSPITIPGTGQKVIIPLHMNLDLYQFFQSRGYQSILNLALALGGANSNTSRLMVRAKPTIRTDFGDITYPDEITIVDKEFRSQ